MSSPSPPSTRLTFYHAPNSTSNVTAAVLAELSHALKSTPHPLNIHRIELSISAGETRSEPYIRTINPNGRVPAIVHEGVPIWESAAITIYLGETFGTLANNDHDGDGDDDDGDKGALYLYPSPGPWRGEAMKWIVWTNTTLVAAGSRYAETLPVGAPGAVEAGSQDEGAAAAAALTDDGTGEGLQKARRDVEAALRILNGALVGREYILGKGYCLADLHVWCFVSWLIIMGVSVEEFGEVRRWVESIGKRPALQDL